MVMMVMLVVVMVMMVVRRCQLKVARSGRVS
jgi:hypothetical protein